MNIRPALTRRNVSLLLDSDDYAALQSLARADGLSVSAHVRLAIKARLSQPVMLATMQAADAHMNTLRAALEART